MKRDIEDQMGYRTSQQYGGSLSHFEKDLTKLINKHSMETESQTADYTLARYLTNCLRNYNDTIAIRSKQSNRPPDA